MCGCRGVFANAPSEFWYSDSCVHFVESRAYNRMGGSVELRIQLCKYAADNEIRMSL